MKLNKKWFGIFAGTIAVAAFALVLSAVAPGTAAAHGGPGGSDRGASGDTYLAEALGISAEELQAAQQQAFEAGLAQAVAEGLLTQEQADQIKERGSRFMGKIAHFGRMGGDAIDDKALLADALGISVDELEAAKQAARDAKLAQAIEDGKITQEQAEQMKAREALKTYLDDQGLKDNMRALYEEAVQQAVEAGVITQEQAEQILENQKGFGRGFGPRGGKGGHRGSGPRGFGGEGFTPRGNTGTAPTALSL